MADPSEAQAEGRCPDRRPGFDERAVTQGLTETGRQTGQQRSLHFQLLSGLHKTQRCTVAVWTAQNTALSLSGRLFLQSDGLLSTGGYNQYMEVMFH